MKVLLKDLDNTGFGNLALMKLSAWHKARGDEVFINMPGDFDLVCISSTFTWNAKKAPSGSGTSLFGGWGFNTKWLPREIEHIMPDYYVYGHDPGYSMGFTSRGCSRHCPWCCVPTKEGNIESWASIYEFWDRRHRLIKLLDNNLLAAPNCMETLEALRKEQVRVDFNQGLDIRLLTDEIVWYLSKIRCRDLRFAFDDWSYHSAIEKGINLLVSAGFSRSHLHFYVLMGHKQDPEEDFARLELLQRNGCNIFPMIYRDGEGIQHAPALGPIPKNMHGSRYSLLKMASLKGVAQRAKPRRV